MPKKLLSFIFLISSMYNSLIIAQSQENNNNFTDDNIESPLCCNLTTTEQVEVEYSSKVVENEYIVTFNGYYKNLARANYINAALNASGIQKWKILSRENPASDYPSDFDVVIFEDTINSNGLNALKDHPSIKRVTSQRMVHRTLKFINRNEYYRRGRNTFSQNSQFWQATGRHTSRRLLRAIPRQITSVLQADALWNMGKKLINDKSLHNEDPVSFQV